MYTADQLWTVLLFAVLVQGLFLGLVLAFGRGPDRPASRLLAALCLVLAAMTGEELVDSANLYTRLPHVALSSFALPLAIGPLMWMIALRFGRAPQPLRAADCLHGLPLLAVALYLVPFYLLDGDLKLEALDGGRGPSLGPLVILKGFHVLGYQLLAIGACTRLLAAGESTNVPRLVWYRRMLAMTLVPVLLIHLLYFFPAPDPIESDRVGSLVVAVTIFAFAYAAMKWPFFGADAAERRPTPEAAAKYRTSALDAGRKRRLRDDLLAHMASEQPYLNPELTPGELAAALGVTAHDMSQVLNEVLGANFRRFVNRYRVDWVKARLDDPAEDRKTLLDLALAAGFNSKTSFNRTFKEHTGLTPSAYRAGRAGRAAVGLAPTHGLDPRPSGHR